MSFRATLKSNQYHANFANHAYSRESAGIYECYIALAVFQISSSAVRSYM